MTELTRLDTVVPIDRLYPPDAAFMARSDLQQTRLLGYTPLNLDAVTTLWIGLLRDRSTVRHVSGTTDEILECLAMAGLPHSEDMHRFTTGDEAEAIADKLITDGKKLFWPYPLRAGRFPDDAQLVAPALWARLNSKEYLSEIVPAHALPRREVLPLSTLQAGVKERPCFLKAAGQDATGWGYAVRHAATDNDLSTAIAELERQGIDRVIVEEAVDVSVCWCVNMSIVDDGITYLGAAEQTFSAPGKQSGSVIDPDVAFPPAGLQLAKQVAETAQAMGFRGICGLDIGLSPDGRLTVFDPNFRGNSSTPQVLFYQSAAARSGLKVSVSFGGLSSRPMKEIIDRIAGPMADGWFVPVRLLDAALLPAADGTSLATGFVLGATRDAADVRADELSKLIT